MKFGVLTSGHTGAQGMDITGRTDLSIALRIAPDLDLEPGNFGLFMIYTILQVMESAEIRSVGTFHSMIVPN